MGWTWPQWAAPAACEFEVVARARLAQQENVLVTPHLASVAIPTPAAEQVVENILAASSGAALKHVVDLSRGY